MAPTIKRFLGLNNVSDPLRLKAGWLQRADNIDITDTGAIVRRDGYTKTFDGDVSAAFCTFDFARMYVVDGGALKRVYDDMTTVTLATGLQALPMQWAEINDQVFYTNGVDSGVITAMGDVLPWAWPVPGPVSCAAAAGSLDPGVYQVTCTYLLPDGRETGAGMTIERLIVEGEALVINDIPQVEGLRTQVYIAPANSTVFSLAFDAPGATATWNSPASALGIDLVTDNYDPLPDGCSYIAAWRGRMCAAQYFPHADFTAVWMSQPLGFHLFNLAEAFIMVPGRATMLAAHNDAMVIGTASRIYAYNGELAELADYGVVPGHTAVRDGKDGPLMFWSTRGLCTAMPFSNITLRNISVDCGVSAGAAIIQKDGAKRYVVALQKGGEIFNQRGT